MSDNFYAIRFPARLMATFFLAAAASGLAGAATYYVDPDLGRDTYAGTSIEPDGSALVGPWRTLAKVSAAALMPGDKVLLRCGQRWRETLTLMRSGASGQPITIGSYPTACVNKPAIDGTLTVLPDAWERHSGNIYKVSLPFSVVPGAPVQQALDGWRIESPLGDAVGRINSACPDTAGGCAEITTRADAATLASGNFALRAGDRYTVRLQVRAPAGSRYSTGLRWGPVQVVGARNYARGVGNGAWQTIEWTFTAASSLVAARLELIVPGASTTTQVRQARVDLELPEQFTVNDAIGARTQLIMAHHPNMGHNAASPYSPYLSAGVSNYVIGPDGRYGSSYVNTGSDLRLPAGAVLGAGLDVWIRSQNWTVKKHSVTSVSGARLNISPHSAYPLVYAGWGYYLTGAMWMLDAPGEWYFDASTKTFYIWMPDNAAPGRRVALSTLPVGVTIGSPITGQFPSHITFDNLALLGVGEGFSMRRMANITMKSLDIREINGFGVDAEGASNLRIESSVFANTASDAVSGIQANDAVLRNNSITNSGVKVDAAGMAISLPRENFHAVQLGARASVSGNRITNAGYNGILVGDDSLVEGNVVQNFALVLNDAGALYASNSARVVVRNNHFLGGYGNRDGVPSVIHTLVSSIYMDDHANGYLLQGNTLVGSDYCILVHDAFNNQIDGNTCFGARRSTLRVQETANGRVASGDLFGNSVTGNQLFQTATGPAIVQESIKTSIEDFATFDRNAYSTLISPLVSMETAPNGYSGSFSLSEWQRAGLASGRTLEPNGYIGAPLSRYALGLLGAGLLTAEQAYADWGRVGSGSPAPTSTPTPNCGPTGGGCLVFNAGGANATLTGPRFAMTKGRTYRISFDGWASDSAQTLKAMVLRAGPTYESLMGLEPFVFSASSAWKRYSMTFVASADATAARIDFNDIVAGRQIRIANLEVVPYSTAGVEPTSLVLANSNFESRSFLCPLTDSQSPACSKLFTFPQGQRVSWPMTLPALGSVILFAQDDSLPDSDGDGIADGQDVCPGSLSTAAVNARGCALGQ